MKKLIWLLLPITIILLLFWPDGRNGENEKLLLENQKILRDIAKLDKNQKQLQAELEKKTGEINVFGEFLLRLSCHPRSLDVLFLKSEERPEIVKKVIPDPEMPLWADLRYRTVILEVEIDEEGNVCRCPCVISGHPGLNVNALRAVIQWKFKPFLIKGKPSHVRFGVVVHF